MIAAIKDRVGKWREAAEDYRQILQQSPEYLPALRLAFYLLSVLSCGGLENYE